MWGAITKFFNKSDKPPDLDNNRHQHLYSQHHLNHQHSKYQINNNFDNIIMDIDTLETRQAKQRASMKWILSKAFNNRVPENLKEPFYRDHEGQEHLKPQITVGLGNASLYCQTLSNLYSDPNYQRLNHWSILQTLTRKGVPMPESDGTPLTETVLIQTNPLRINAHMSVIEALMILYAKEVASGDRVGAAISRISGGTLPSGTQNYETALLCWVSHVCAALKRRIDQEIDTGAIQDENGGRIQSPDMPPIRDYRDLCDGVCLAYLMSYYCPKVVPWPSVRVNYLPTVEDSIHNVLLVSNFSQKHLPYSVFHMTPEDITYMRGSMKQNLVVLLGDLFNLFELHPAKCVCYPGMDSHLEIDRSGLNEHGIGHRRGLTCKPVTPIPDLRCGLDSPTNSGGRPPFQVMRSPSATTVRKHTPPRDERENNNYGGPGDEGFVVHKGRGVTTLSSMQEPLVPARLRQAKEKTNTDTKADERGDTSTIAAGRPSNWEDTRRPSYAGRRSRRNSTSDDSQLTIENFGGSQDHLNLIGRSGGGGGTLERERKTSNSHQPVMMNIEPVVPVRSTLADARGSIQIGYETDSGSEKQDRETEKMHSTNLKRQTSMNNVSIRNNTNSQQHPKEEDSVDGDGSRSIQSSPPITYGDDDVAKRKTSFATLPSNQTTWQQQSANLQQLDNNEFNNDEPRPNIDATKLSTIRLKLEEKRRHIEQEKRKIEVALSRQQQKVGKAAFLQAINKGKVHGQNDSDTVVSSDTTTTQNNNSMKKDDKPERPCSLQDITSGDTIGMDSKWEPQIESKRTPDLDHVDLETYQQSIAMMNTSLFDIQADIQRLAQQQNQIQAQHIQAQQILQAQQYANVMQQQYGSQHNIGGYRPIQQNFGSTPHIANQPAYMLNRPPSRDPHQNIQFINEQGQYVNPIYGREGSPGQYSNDNGYGGYGGSRNDLHYNNQYIESNQFRHDPSPPIQYRQETPPQQYQDVYAVREPQQAPPPTNQFYLHDSPTPPPRRTWAQSAAANQQQQPPQTTNQIPLDITAWAQNQPQKIDTRTWKSPHSHQSSASSGSGGSGSGGFMLHQNGNDYDNQEQTYQNLFPVHSSPQHNPRIQKQVSQIISGPNQPTNNIDIGKNLINNNDFRDNRMPKSPPMDEMAPQSISFIGDEDDSVDPLVHQTSSNLSKLNISSGSRTYRIPSPTRPHLSSKSFQNPQDDDINNEKGFYISFDDEQPKRPKPPLRTKKSPKKERTESEGSGDKREQISQLEKELNEERNNRFSENNYNIEEPMIVKRSSLVDSQTVDRRQSHHHQPQPQQQQPHHHLHQNDINNIFSHTPHDQRNHYDDRINNTNLNNNNNNNSSHNNNLSDKSKESKALVIGELSNLDPNSVDEMERKKEKIMLLSLQRRQQQEEAKSRKEIDAMQRREREQEKEDERSRRKEEQAARRQAILEAHKLKKAIDEAEREGKTIDKNDLMLLKQHTANLQQSSSNSNAGTAKLRQTKNTRPRPKTIHVESGSVDLSDSSSLASRGKKGSSTNLTGHGSLSSNSMRRDYYRGSQDSLAIRESPDEYPSTTSTPLGRRGSYKTAREPTIERGRTLSRISVAKGANFRGRKSNSLMNLCANNSSSIGFRKKQTTFSQLPNYTDSGLGRATPPRRAPSPGMGPSSRHLPSPSGPGSLPPGLMTKRRMFDDGSSDISSTPSSMMEYTGPKLYKQPATKSNRGIILNAVEYCVFPGAVNRDAKQKVLEKIARAEAKHFLILFRDAGCQFRALYSYWPENETILKLYGTGPSQVDDVMFDKFFKYNSGGKCFSQIHTKHLTVTIDAFTIHNSLWQGKKVNLPNKKDMTLVI